MTPESQPQSKIEVASAPVGPSRSPEEKKALYQKLRARLGQSRFRVAKSAPGFTPYWARKDDAEEMSRLDVLGFRIVHDDPKSPRYQANGLKEDGTYQLGDVILMEISTDEYDFYKQDNLERAHVLAYGAKKAFINEAQGQNVPAFEVDSQHRKQKG